MHARTVRCTLTPLHPYTLTPSLAVVPGVNQMVVTHEVFPDEIEAGLSVGADSAVPVPAKQLRDEAPSVAPGIRVCDKQVRPMFPNVQCD